MRPPHLQVLRTPTRTWEVRVRVADGGWQVSEHWTAAEALSAALDIINRRRVQEVRVTEVSG